MLEWTTTYYQNGRHLAAVRGELCFPHISGMLSSIHRAIADANHLVLDLSRISAIDGAGFQLLAVLKKEAASTGKKLKFIRHSAAVLDILATFGAVGLFQDRVVLHSAADKIEKFSYGTNRQDFL